MLGSHLSIAGGLHNALLSAEALSCDTVQIFTKNQQQWRCPPLSDESIAEWKSHAKRLKFKKTVSHDSYLINLAAVEPVILTKSVDLFVEELVRCGQLGIPFLVTHPGAHMGAGEAEGLKKIAASFDTVHERVADEGVITCLEITAGQGSSLGYQLEHLAEIMGRVKSPRRLGVCLDTAHLFAAGYDFRGKKYSAFRNQIERSVGIKKVKVLHLNDSKKELGSRVDRHEHIGMGKIGREGFEPFVNDSAWAKTPKILETAKGKNEDGRDWDEINLEVLRSMVR